MAGLYEVRKSADLADDMFLARALEGRAGYVVSGDSHLLKIGSCHGVLIIPPPQFMTLLAMAERQGEGRE